MNHIRLLSMAPQVGFEPTAYRLTAECSTVELLRNINAPQRSILPGSHPPSTFDAKELNFCVRDGNRCGLFAIVTKQINKFDIIIIPQMDYNCKNKVTQNSIKFLTVCTLPLDQDLGRLVPVSSIHYCTSTSGLSTRSSTGGLTPSRG